ncbi:MAG: hypothetical protein ABR976_06880 [Terracidiphilus sp.]|jgi:hypothetical protein
MDSPSLGLRAEVAERAEVGLDEYLCERDPARAAELLDRIVVTRVEPLATRIVRFRLRSFDEEHRSQSEDVAADAVVAFLLHLEALKQGHAPPIVRLDAFVSTLASRACNDYFRRARPAFHSLRNKLRYLLEKYPEFTRWQDTHSGEWLCGLAAQIDWRPALQIADRSDWLPPHVERLHPADQLTRIFESAGGPIRFDDLAAVMARVWDVQEVAPAPTEEYEIPAAEVSVDLTLEQRQWLGILWSQICALNRNQRVALLLNLRCSDGSCGASLIVSTGIATMRQIAEVLQISALEFAGLWMRLPIGDLEIASTLGLTRQQVVNLRKSARARLARAMHSKL